MIKRSKTIELEYQDEQNESHTLVLVKYIQVRCVQHECDHLNNILFIQRASRLKLERFSQTRPKERKKRIEYEQRMDLARYFADQKRKK